MSIHQIPNTDFERVRGWLLVLRNRGFNPAVVDLALGLASEKLVRKTNYLEELTIPKEQASGSTALDLLTIFERRLAMKRRRGIEVPGLAELVDVLRSLAQLEGSKFELMIFEQFMVGESDEEKKLLVFYFLKKSILPIACILLPCV